MGKDHVVDGDMPIFDPSSPGTRDSVVAGKSSFIFLLYIMFQSKEKSTSYHEDTETEWIVCRVK